MKAEAESLRAQQAYATAAAFVEKTSLEAQNKRAKARALRHRLEANKFRLTTARELVKQARVSSKIADKAKVRAHAKYLKLRHTLDDQWQIAKTEGRAAACAADAAWG